MERDQNSALTCYGWRSKLPYRTIFFPTQPYLETMSLSELYVKRHVVDKLQWQLHCQSTGDVMNLSDQDILRMRNLGIRSFYELRDDLFESTGREVEDHEYFNDPDVKTFLLYLEEGIAPKKSDLDSRKWMAEKYYLTNGVTI